ncbi:MAG TPA: hypothetical protein VMI31_00805 [Fimbriimonadaceae bacterium]|nr:hypothetical protein [Fimbriimonadaceae bacterium]
MEVQTAPQPGLRHGIYSYREAARLLGVASQRVSRWADGYVFQLKYGQGKSRPVLQTERHPGVLSFAELFELFFVREYVGLGVPLQHVRATAEALAREFGPYPFSRSEVLIGGRELLVKNAEGLLRRPDVGQLVADYAEWMVKQVQFRQEVVGRYSPPEFDDQVFLDREIRGGEAVVTEFAIPTRVIYSLWVREKDMSVVAAYHDIPVGSVSLAVRYEAQWRLAA